MGNAIRKISAGDYMGSLAERRRTSRRWQATLHQQDAVDTARLLGDMPRLPFYLRTFKVNRLRRGDLLRCRDWVMSREGVRNRGAMFASLLCRFLRGGAVYKKSGMQYDKGDG